MVKIIPSERKVTGYCRNNHGGVPENFHNYFVAVFDKDFSSAYTWKDGKLNVSKLENEGEHTGAVLGFKTVEGEVINVKVASSFISPEQAELNLKRETEGKDFETVMNEGKEKWNRELKKDHD